MSSKASTNGSSAKDDDQKDDRGVAFGAGGTYDDAYAGGEEPEYVTELPTLDEEQKMLGNARAREDMESMDEGRASNHPSTLAASRTGKVSEPRSLLCLHSITFQVFPNDCQFSFFTAD
jgi:hypothetical protein